MLLVRGKRCYSSMNAYANWSGDTQRSRKHVKCRVFGSATDKSRMFTASFGFLLQITCFMLKRKSFSYRMVWWSVAGFSVLQQTAQRTRCLYTLMGLAARNADVSITRQHIYRSSRKQKKHSQPNLWKPPLLVCKNTFSNTQISAGLYSITFMLLCLKHGLNLI